MANDLSSMFSFPTKENMRDRVNSPLTQAALALIGNHGSLQRQRGAFEGVGPAINRSMDYQAEQEEKRAEQEQANMTMQYLQANDPEAFEVATATGSPMQGFQFLMQKRNQKPAERKILKGADGFNYYADTAERVLPGVEIAAPEQKGSYTSPFQGIGPDGKAIWVQADSNGNVKTIDGIAPNNPIKVVNTKTEQIFYDSRTGSEIGRTPIENQDAAYDTAYGAGLGKDQAEVTNSADSLESKMVGLRGVVDELRDLSETATYTMGGRLLDEGRKQLGMGISEAGVDRAKYIAIVDNQVLPLLKDTFGAAFTVQEGESLRATLGDPDKSPQEKQAVLEAFIAQKERDLAALQQQSGQTSSQVTDFNDYFSE